MARLLRLLLFCLWPLGTLSASEILLVGGEEQPGVRSFVEALQGRRGHDQVRFQSTAALPAPLSSRLTCAWCCSTTARWTGA